VRRLLTIALGIGALAVAGPAQAFISPADNQTKTPIKHFIVLMQENHSYDNYFGTYRGIHGDANRAPASTCEMHNLKKPRLGCVKPYRIGNSPIQDLNHSTRVAHRQFDNGKMDGFVDALRREGEGHPSTMGYYDGNDIPYYWNIADNYVLFDRFFTSAAGGSVGNHMFWVTGTPGNRKADVIPPQGFSQETIFDRLEAKHISWKFYVQNYDRGITFRNRGIGDRGSQIVWVPLLNYPRFLDNPRLRSHIVDMSQYYKDAQNGTLPAVSYLAPAGSSEHPPGSIQAGERFVRTLINSLARSDSWSSSAFMWSYDDWGGWFDHVKPPQVDKFGYGFRAPGLLVSAYARRGQVNHTTLDFTSMLKFVEENWGLKPLASRDRKAQTFMSAFDFKSPPRQPEFVAATRGTPKKAEPVRLVVYLAYALAVGLAALAIAFALVGERRRRRMGELPEPEPDVAEEVGV
jgi:phospholipase C